MLVLARGADSMRHGGHVPPSLLQITGHGGTVGIEERQTRN